MEDSNAYIDVQPTQRPQSVVDGNNDHVTHIGGRRRFVNGAFARAELEVTAMDPEQHGHQSAYVHITRTDERTIRYDESHKKVTIAIGSARDDISTSI